MSNIKKHIKLMAFFLAIIFALIACYVKLSKPVYSPLKEADQGYSEFEAEGVETEVVEEKTLTNNRKRLALAIIIDNLSSSWPVAGLNKALIVYEAPVEADITRLLAIFSQDSLPQKIGPVRSARPYFADWAAEYKGIFIHAGGSPQALDNIKSHLYDFYNLDEIGGDGIYFWRDAQRSRPHNLYILPESIERAIKKKGWPLDVNDDFLELDVKKKIVSSDDEIDSSIIKIDYKEPVIWQFDRAMNSYFRYQNNKPFMDEGNGQIRSSNVIIQKTEVKILDKIGRRLIKTFGHGDAFIFQGGHVIKGVWIKNQTTGRTFFYDQQGEKIKFLPGPVWIEIVGESHKIFF